MNLEENIKKKVIFGREVISSEKDGKVILGNCLTGNTVKMTKDCYDAVCDCVNGEKTVSDFLSEYDADSREYLEKLILLLLERHILFAADHKKDFEFRKFGSVNLLLTNKCNLRCIHCCMDAGCDISENELTTEEWKQVIDKLAELDLSRVAVSGGEPLMRKDFYEISEYLREKLHAKLELMTNGTLITEENVDRLVDLYDGFSLSIDGVDEESCAAIRGKGTFSQIMRGIELLKSRNVKRISLSFTIVRQNEDKSEEFVKFAEDLGVFPVRRYLDIVGRAADHPELIPTDYARYEDSTLSCPIPDKGHYPPNKMPDCTACNAGYCKVAIDSKGDIYPCPAFVVPGYELGNMLQIDSFKDYVETEEMFRHKGFEAFNDINPVHSEKCKDCPAKLFCVSCVFQSYIILNSKDREAKCNKRREGLMSVWN